MKNNDNFYISLSISSALHLLVIYLFLFGIPFFSRSNILDEQIITFEMLSVSEISNIPTQKKADPKLKEEIIENDDSKNINNIPAPPIKPEPPKPVEEKIIEQPKKIEEEKKAEPINLGEKVTPKDEKKEEIKPPLIKPLPPVVKPPAIKKKLPTNDDLDSLLKNLEQASSGTNPKSNKRSKNKAGESENESKGPYNEGQPLSISEKALIKQQIEKYWNIPIGAEDIDQARILLHIILEKDGTVLEVSITKKICSDIPFAICQALADSAVRAVKQASPIENLNPTRYKTWKEFNLEMDPSHAAG